VRSFRRGADYALNDRGDGRPEQFRHRGRYSEEKRRPRAVSASAFDTEVAPT
jgi:hypothetical protein